MTATTATFRYTATVNGNVDGAVTACAERVLAARAAEMAALAAEVADFLFRQAAHLEAFGERLVNFYAKVAALVQEHGDRDARVDDSTHAALEHIEDDFAFEHAEREGKVARELVALRRSAGTDELDENFATVCGMLDGIAKGYR